MRSPLAPRFRLYIGSNGKTIPNPIRSMKTVRKMTRTEGFLMNKRQPLTRRLQAQSATTSAKSICERLPVKREGKHPAPTNAAGYMAQSAKAAAQLCDHRYCPGARQQASAGVVCRGQLRRNRPVEWGTWTSGI